MDLETSSQLINDKVSESQVFGEDDPIVDIYYDDGEWCMTKEYALI